MFFRALTALLVLPGLVTGLVPYLLFLTDPWRGEGYTLGLLVMAAGLFLLLWCVRDFYKSGKGTLAPWSPPKHLVIVGLYGFCRNPMYLGVLVLVFGEAVFSASPLLVCYLAVLIFSFHLRVILYEEPQLSKLFGVDWESYSSSVHRWLPSYTILKDKITS